MIIKENNTEITNTLEIANIFNTYFTNIGSNLAKSIHYSGEKKHRYYFKIAKNKNFKFKEIDEETIKRTINNLLKKIAVDPIVYLQIY